MNKLHCTIPAPHNVDDYYDRAVWEHAHPSGSPKGSTYKGIRNAIKPDDALYIRELHKSGESAYSIAADLGVHQTQVLRCI